ncbi:HK97 family phage protein [Paraburkholderia tropica]
MANKAGAKISDANGFGALLANMSDAASESTLRQAGAAGATVIRNEIVLRAPVGPLSHLRSGRTYPAGTLKKTVIVFHDDEKSSVAGQVQVYGVTLGSDAFYGRLVEGGHVLSGAFAKHVKEVEFGNSQVPAHPFFRPAVAAKQSEAVQAMVDVMKKKLDEAKNG